MLNYETRKSPDALVCVHCGSVCRSGQRFCCAGCEAVYSLLTAKGLTHYYSLRDQYSFNKAKPVSLAQAKTVPKELAEKSKTLLFIEGVHCLGCLWLLEKLPEIQEGVLNSKLDIAHHTLEVTIDPTQTQWNVVFTLIQHLGYTVKPIRESELAEVMHKNQIRQLTRIGVAAAGTGNIMLLAICLYAGAGGWLGKNFQWLSFFLSIPVLTYSAWPIYQGGFAPLRKGRISVDLPIAFALIAGIILSAWSLLAKDGTQIYFDSLSMLVLLLLSSRYLLQRLRESFAKHPTSLQFFSEQTVSVSLPSGWKESSVTELKVGDLFRLGFGQLLPLDAKLLTTAVHGDLSLLTGESLPHRFQLGDALDSGTKILETAEFEALRSIKDSRLGKILDLTQSYREVRSPSLDLAERVGKYFAIIVLVLAAIVFAVYFPHQPDQAIQRALALVIVTCPCILAFAIPLSFVKNLQRAAKDGILFQNAEKLEALSDVEAIFFDKTGTLTEGNFSVTAWVGDLNSETETKSAVAALESRSTHPVAKSILRYLNLPANFVLPAVDDYQEILGLGVQGTIQGNFWQLRQDKTKSTSGLNVVEVLKNRNTCARISLGDSVRKETAKMISELSQKGYQLAILSGDKTENVKSFAQKLGISHYRGELSPEDKAAAIRAVPNSLIIGDGANDSVAFQAGTVSVAMQGSVELSTKNADIVLTRPGLGGLLHAINLSKQTRSLVRQNFTFTLAYNLAAGTFAITGYMTPLRAAILMPVSALTVFLYIHLVTPWRLG